MMQYMNVEQYARIRYGTPPGEKPTQAQLNTVRAMCQRSMQLVKQGGKPIIPCVKSGRNWIIGIEMEGI